MFETLRHTHSSPHILFIFSLLPLPPCSMPPRVNKEYDSVLQASVMTHGATSDPEWVQVYRGIARGLGSINTNITQCVEDGNRTVETFRAAFESFKILKIFDGRQ